MARNAQWVSFISLLDIDGQRTDQLGESARNLKAKMAEYMKLRFNTEEVGALVDIVNDQGVIDAVVLSLGHQTTDAEAIMSSVVAVITAP